MHRIFDRPVACLTGCALLIATTACGDGPTEPAAAQEGCPASGSLSVAMYGGIRGDLEWQGSDLRCSGMPRPKGQGARLHFSGSIESDGESRTLAFIIGLPELERASAARETPAIVTLIEEDGGRFYSSADAPVCWSDVSEQTLIVGDEYEISGIVYCVSPLAELNGPGGVSFTELGFSGTVDWGSPD